MSFHRPIAILLSLIVLEGISFTALRAQGGPPFYTNDTGTPGANSWEINWGYMPFLYQNSSTSHVPDLDVNYGIGNRIQLTYESAWLRIAGAGNAKYGMAQDQLGVKWHFYDNKTSGLAISVFPQLSVNNPNSSVRRGLTPPGASLLLPVEVSKPAGPVDLNFEAGYNVVHLGADGWTAGFAAGHQFTRKLELDGEFYSSGAFQRVEYQDTVDAGGRYALRPYLIALFMAGRSVAPARGNQPYFVGYFGVQLLLEKWRLKK
jgi:hypothetical protein